MFVAGKYVYTIALQGKDYTDTEWDIWIVGSEVHLTPEQVHAAILLRHVELLVDWGFADHEGNIKPTTKIQVHETDVLEL